MRKAIILLSGGLDSTTVLFWAKARGFDVQALIFDYGQRHRKELLRARKIASAAQVKSQIVRVTFPWKGSALVDQKISVPMDRRISPHVIPPTYVPARNLIFLSFAAAFAEVIGARTIAIGANALDYSGYPDCRPEFFRAFQTVLKKGLKAGVQGKTIKVVAPLLHKTKKEIIALGIKLGAPYALTWSCYLGGKNPCGRCDSCRLRMKGFRELGLTDPGCSQ